MRLFLLATTMLMTTIVGVGMFSLPFVGAQSGFPIAALFLLVLAGIIVTIHLLYGEIVCKTEGRHRLVGYAGHYLGKWGKGIVSISVVVGFYSSLLVYIIVGGDFLYDILSPFVNLSPIIYNFIFFAIGAFAVYFGLKFIAGTDVLMGFFLAAIVILFFYLGFSRINFDNLTKINWHNTFLPYGAILYSLAGMAAIPEIKDFFSKKNSNIYKKSIFWGTLIPAILYLVFMFTVIGLTGNETTSEAISGLRTLFGEKVVFFGALFGFLATITSFFSLGLSLKETFICDYKINKNIAWLLVCFVPLLLFAFGFYNFVVIIVLTGALLGAIEGTMIVLIHRKISKLGNQSGGYNFKVPPALNYIIILVFVVGFICTLIFTL